MKLTFYGAAQTVTGSNHLLEVGDVKILIDCGLFQGSADAEMKNYEPFAYNPSEVTAVLLTHSHADHTGRLPKLYKEGFRGPLYSTSASLEMTFVALPDNLGLMTDAAKRTHHAPLFNQEDLDGIAGLAHPVEYGQAISVAPGVTAIFHDAGHILGSAIIEVQAEGKKIYFSGDLGNPPTPLLKTFEYPLDADYIVVDSTYGDKVHEDRSTRKEKLRAVIKETMAKGGVLMMPSFAMERTQELLFEIEQMRTSGEIAAVPMFVDSPLAIKLTEVYEQHSDYFNQAAMDIVKSGKDLFNFPGLTYCRTSEESRRINDVPAPKVIIAGSGMSSGGRILHHERRYLSDPNSTILFVGFQAEGTLGRKIFEGEKNVTIFGEPVDVRCRIEAIGGYSAHADQPMILSWLAKGAEGGKLKGVFPVHGEIATASVLAAKITETFHVPATVPHPGQTVEL